eukprot:405913-Pyramimonas_sp.AAC.1
MHRRRRREANRAPNRAASAMHRRCGAILRPHLLLPHVGGLEVSSAELGSGDATSTWSRR